MPVTPPSSSINMLFGRRLCTTPCVVIPFFVMLWARGYVWATEAYAALKFFHDEGDDAFFYGALPLSVLMTLFNLVLIVDVTQGFVKYVVLGQRDGGVTKAGSGGTSMH